MNDTDLALLFAGLQRIEQRQQAIERKLDTLIAALAADEELEPELEDLEGRQFGGERDGTQSLD